MSEALYVVTETVDIGASSFEMLSPAQNLGGVFDDLCPALLALAKENSQGDRRLYLASFEHGRLTPGTLLMGVYYDGGTQKHRMIDLT